MLSPHDLIIRQRTHHHSNRLLSTFHHRCTHPKSPKTTTLLANNREWEKKTSWYRIYFFFVQSGLSRGQSVNVWEREYEKKYVRWIKYVVRQWGWWWWQTSLVCVCVPMMAPLQMSIVSSLSSKATTKHVVNIPQSNSIIFIRFVNARTLSMTSATVTRTHPSRVYGQCQDVMSIASYHFIGHSKAINRTISRLRSPSISALKR